MLKINNNIDIVIDYNGNLYFEYLNKIYDININSDNDLTLEVFNPNIVEYNNYDIQIKKLDKVFKSNSLKEFVSKKITEYDEDDYYYENNEFYETEENYDIYQDNNDEYILFYCEDLKPKLKFKNYQSEISIYDIFLYNDDINHGSLYLRTKTVGIEPCYRIKLYIDGTILFRPIGMNDIIYNIITNNNELIIKKI